MPTNLIHNIYRETTLLNLLPHVTGAIELKQSNLTCPYLVVKSMQGDSTVWLGHPHCSSHGNGMQRRPHQSLLHHQAFCCKSVDIWFSSSWQKFHHRGPVSISDKTSYSKISQSLEVARFLFIIVRTLLNLTGSSVALLPMCQPNFKAMQRPKVPIVRLRDLTMRRLIRYWSGSGTLMES